MGTIYSTLFGPKFVVEIPDHIKSCREEKEVAMKNSSEDIEVRNEIVRGLNQLSTERALESVRRRCEELRQEYSALKIQQKESNYQVQVKSNLSTSKERQPTTTTTANNHQSYKAAKLHTQHIVAGTVDVPSELIPDDTVDGGDENGIENHSNELEEEYSNIICDYLQEQLNVTINIRDIDVRRKELGDIIFYYLRRGGKPDQHIQKVIIRIYDPLYEHTHTYYNYGWYELCCVVLHDERSFPQLCERLDKDALQYFLYEQPQLLFNKRSSELMHRLIEHLLYSNLHQIITNIRDSNGQTHMSYIDSALNIEPYIELYNNHVKDLYELLFIQGTNGQTALHVNTSCITPLLADTYTPLQRAAFMKLTAITDNYNKTALQVSNWIELSSLMRRVENNEYIMYGYYDTNILIIYNTHNRSGAEAEALTIHDACKTKYYGQTTLEKNKHEKEIIELVKKTANKRTNRGDLPRSLIVILMSHGTVGTIDDCDGNSMKLSDIEEAMCSDVLDGRPKMLITQCCQNGTEEVDKKLKPYAPTHDHFCAVMSCVTGQKSKRGVFLGKFAEKMKNGHPNINIFKLVRTVSTEIENEGHKQTPIIMSTLRAEFCATGWWPISK